MILFNGWHLGLFIPLRVCLGGYLPHIWVRPGEGKDFVIGDVPPSWANTAGCLTWFGSIKEANRLLTPASIPHRSSRAYKNPFWRPLINTALIIVCRSGAHSTP